MGFPKIITEEDFDEHFQSEIWLDAAEEICGRHRIAFNELKRASSSDHVVFLVDNVLFIKNYRPFRNCFEREMKAIEFVSGKVDFATPVIVETGEFEDLKYVLMTQIAGESITRGDWLKYGEKQQSAFITELAIGLKKIHELSAESFENNWADFVENRAASFIERQITYGVNAEIIEMLPQFIEDNLTLVPKNGASVFMHADVHFGNLRVLNKDGKLEIAGLFDFADSRVGFREYEFLAVGVLMIQGQGKLQREFFKSYGYAESDLNEEMRRRLMMLTMLYETADLRRYALRLKPEAVDYPLDKLEREIWSFVK